MFRVPNSGDFGLGTEKQRGRRVWSAVGSASRPAGPRPGHCRLAAFPLGSPSLSRTSPAPWVARSPSPGERPRNVLCSVQNFIP